MTVPTLPTLKICGITNAKDATAAVEAGADYLGLIFVPNTPRFISVEAAQSIVNLVRGEKPSAQIIGVFQNATEATIQRHVSALSLDGVQLHGQESPEFCAQISVPIIKTLLIHPDCDFAALMEQVNAYLAVPNVKTLLLDLPKGSAVKTVLDLPESERFREFLVNFPCWLAGGLNPDNIEQALSNFQPKGVDVASGVEQSVGQKDLGKVAAFCQVVKSFQLKHNQGDERLCNL